MKLRSTGTTCITTKGQIVIPKDIRSRMGWNPGTRLQIETRGESVTLRPVNGDTARAWLDDIAGCVVKGDPLGDLEKEHREEVKADARRRS